MNSLNSLHSILMLAYQEPEAELKRLHENKGLRLVLPSVWEVTLAAPDSAKTEDLIRRIQMLHHLRVYRDLLTSNQVEIRDMFSDKSDSDWEPCTVSHHFQEAAERLAEDKVIPLEFLCCTLTRQDPAARGSLVPPNLTIGDVLRAVVLRDEIRINYSKMTRYIRLFTQQPVPIRDLDPLL